MDKYNRQTFRDVAAVLLCEYITLAGPNGDAIKTILGKIYFSNDRKNFEMRFLKDLSPFLSANLLYPSILMTIAYFNYVQLRTNTKNTEKIKILTKVRCKSLDSVSKFSLTIPPSAIAKTIHGLLNDPTLDPYRFHSVIKSYLDRLSGKIQFIIDDSYSFDQKKYCWAYNLFKYCKNRKCQVLEICPNCHKDHPLIQCHETPYWIKQRMMKYNYSLTHPRAKNAELNNKNAYRNNNNQNDTNSSK